MYHAVQQKKFSFLHTDCRSVFCLDLRRNGEYFPIQQ